MSTHQRYRHCRISVAILAIATLVLPYPLWAADTLRTPQRQEGGLEELERSLGNRPSRADAGMEEGGISRREFLAWMGRLAAAATGAPALNLTDAASPDWMGPLAQQFAKNPEALTRLESRVAALARLTALPAVPSMLVESLFGMIRDTIMSAANPSGNSTELLRVPDVQTRLEKVGDRLEAIGRARGIAQQTGWLQRLRTFIADPRQFQVALDIRVIQESRTLMDLVVERGADSEKTAQWIGALVTRDPEAAEGAIVNFVEVNRAADSADLLPFDDWFGKIASSLPETDRRPENRLWRALVDQEGEEFRARAEQTMFDAIQRLPQELQTRLRTHRAIQHLETRVRSSQQSEQQAPEESSADQVPVRSNALIPTPLSTVRRLDESGAGGVRFAHNKDRPGIVGFYIERTGLPYSALLARALAQGHQVPFAGVATRAEIEALVQTLPATAGQQLQERLIPIDTFGDDESKQMAEALIKKLVPQGERDALVIVHVDDVWKTDLVFQILAYLRFAGLRPETWSDLDRALALLQAA